PALTKIVIAQHSIVVISGAGWDLLSADPQSRTRCGDLPSRGRIAAHRERLPAGTPPKNCHSTPDTALPSYMPLRFAVAILAILACGGSVDGHPGPSAPREAAAADAIAAAAMRDDAVRQAQEALQQGRPYVATRLLQPALRDSTRRTPEVELLAARASAAWGGWGEVRKALSGATWLDRRF